MLNEKGQRELAYLVTVDEIREIPNYDRICQYRVGGWWLVSGKGDYQVGDTALYIEIDSLCPYTEQFAFLNEQFNENGEKIRPDRHKIKTQRFVKGTALSQGLLCPLKDFPQLQGKEVGYFCTEELGITYYEKEDNVRKASNEQLVNMKVEKRLERWSKKHKFLSKFKLIVKWKRKSILNSIRKQQQKKKSDWNLRLGEISHTDEERCQNCFNQMKSLNLKWMVTEKIDGTSTTFFLRRGKKEPFTVCSRNVVYDAPEKEDRNFYKDTDGNVYLKMAEKYNIEELFNNILRDNPTFEYICFQGETYGGTIQKRNYGNEHKFALFNLIYQEKGKNQVRLNPLDMLKQIENWNKKYNAHYACGDSDIRITTAHTAYDISNTFVDNKTTDKRLILESVNTDCINTATNFYCIDRTTVNKGTCTVYHYTVSNIRYTVNFDFMYVTVSIGMRKHRSFICFIVFRYFFVAPINSKYIF